MVTVARHELRLLGGASLATPVLVLLLFGGMAALMAFLGAEDAQVARMLVSPLEMGLPLAAGILAAGIAADDPARDLQLALKVPYRRTLARRLVLLVLWTALPALLWTTALHLAGIWELWVPGTFLAAQLVWLSPLSWFVAAGALLALALGGRSGAGAVLAGVWVVENLFRDWFRSGGWPQQEFLFATIYAPGADFWLSNRVVLILTALLMGAVVWVLSSNTDLLSKGGEA